MVVAARARRPSETRSRDAACSSLVRRGVLRSIARRRCRSGDPRGSLNGNAHSPASQFLLGSRSGAPIRNRGNDISPAMATTETFRATAGISTLNSGSGLYKLAKMGSNASSHAQSDVEVAHMEAQFTGPDLLDSAKELLQINENEEAERKALLDSMQAYDEILTRIDRKASAKSDGGLSDTHTQSTHGQDFDSAQVRPSPPLHSCIMPVVSERTTERPPIFFAHRALRGAARPPRVFPRAVHGDRAN